jgi:anaerobic selenocysteine-containing dehydrogenase
MVLADGSEPVLRGEYNVKGKAAKPAFEVFVDSLAGITPAYVEEVAGVPAATVERLALQIGRSARIGASVVMDGKRLRYRPVSLHTFRGLAAKQYGTQNWRAGLVLQMLIGNVDAVGGINLHGVNSHPEYMQSSKAEYPPKRVDLQKSAFFPHATHNVAQQVALTLLDPEAYGLEYTPEMQIFYATNRPFSTSESHKQIESLKKTFNVVIEIVMSETAAMADIVLPDLTYLESWHLSPTRYTPTSKHTAIRQPVVANVYNIPHDAYSVLWELSRRLGIRDKYIEQVNKQWKLKKYPLEPGRDYSAREAVEHIWKEKTKGKDFEYALDHGFLGKHLKVEDTYLKGVEKHFRGAGKPKMSFYADHLAGSFENVKAAKEKHDIKRIDLDAYRVALSPIPLKAHAFPTPHVEAEDHPLYLITYKRMYRNQSGNTALNPVLNALGADTDENFVLINTVTAKTLDIGADDMVVVETRVGKVQGRPRITQGIRPDTVAVSYGYGQAAPGLPEFARKGIWVNPVIEFHADVVSGMDSFNDTKCKVYKA